MTTFYPPLSIGLEPVQTPHYYKSSEIHNGQNNNCYTNSCNCSNNQCNGNCQSSNGGRWRLVGFDNVVNCAGCNCCYIGVIILFFFAVLFSVIISVGYRVNTNTIRVAPAAEVNRQVIVPVQNPPPTPVATSYPILTVTPRPLPVVTPSLLPPPPNNLPFLPNRVIQSPILSTSNINNFNHLESIGSNTIADTQAICDLSSPLSCQTSWAITGNVPVPVNYESYKWIGSRCNAACTRINNVLKILSEGQGICVCTTIPA